MNEIDVIEVARDSIFVMLICVGPLLIFAMLLGLIIGILQTLTQVQEMTLVFVPKLLAIFLVLILMIPFIIGRMQFFANSLFDRIIAIGTGI